MESTRISRKIVSIFQNLSAISVFILFKSFFPPRLVKISACSFPFFHYHPECPSRLGTPVLETAWRSGHRSRLTINRNTSFGYCLTAKCCLGCSFSIFASWACWSLYPWERASLSERWNFRALKFLFVSVPAWLLISDEEETVSGLGFFLSSELHSWNLVDLMKQAHERDVWSDVTGLIEARPGP